MSSGIGPRVESGSKKTREIMTPKTPTNKTAMTAEIGSGNESPIPVPDKNKVIYAPYVRNSPYAKLMNRVTPYDSVNPTAPTEITLPSINP
jgi:hypothetical protein